MRFHRRAACRSHSTIIACGHHQKQLCETLFSSLLRWASLHRKTSPHPHRGPRPHMVYYRLATSNALQEQQLQQEGPSCGQSMANQIQTLCQRGQLDMAIDVMSHMDHPATDHTYMSLLNACSKNKALNHARRVHTHLAIHGLTFTCSLGNYLVETLAKCGGIEDALHIFHSLPCHTVLSWTAIISAYTECGRGREALKLYPLMLEDGIEPNHFTYVTLLKACGSISALKEGKNIHAAARKNGFAFNVFIGSTLVSMYGKCGCIMEAENVFCELPVRNVVTWNAMLSAYAEQDEGEKALQLYRQMNEEGVCPYERTFAIAIQACGIFADKEEAIAVEEQNTKVIALEIGRALHVDALRKCSASGVFIGSALLSMYGKCGSIVEAENVLSRLSDRNIVSWNVLLSAYLEHKQAKKALHLYRKMQEEGMSPDELTFVAVLQACGTFAEKEEHTVVDGRSVKETSLEIVKALHGDARRKGFSSDIFLGSTLMTTYGKCGSIIDAETVFSGLLERDVVTWNAMLSVYVDQGQGEKALRLYRQMQEEEVGGEERTYVVALQACCILAEKETAMVVQGQLIKETSLTFGQAIHAHARKKGFTSEMFLSNTLVSMYCKCGSIMKAENVFGGMSKHDIVSWCAMLTAYVEQGEGEKALQLFRQMHVEGVNRDQLSCVIALQACGTLAGEEEAVFVEGRLIKLLSLKIGHAIHAYAQIKDFALDVIVGSTLVSMYGKCGAVEEAETVFNGSILRDIVSWNAMLSAYLEQGYSDEALQLYRLMQKERVTLDDVTLICVLQTCSETENEEICRQLYFTIVSSAYKMSLLLANTLIHAYGSCATMENANAVFDGLCWSDVVSWTACIAGHAREGNIVASLQMFEEMHLAHIKPDGVTFVSLLSACSHAGLVNEGAEYFEFMNRGYGITPSLKHYAGMVDLLGRAGNFKKMEGLLSRMPMQADLTTWLSLLAVCRTHGNRELGKHAFDCAVHIQPTETTAYILMSNIYADAGLQD